MNKVVLIGRLTRDPELRFTAGSGTAVATFTLAVDRQFKNKDGQKEADFINIVVWNKLAELVSNYLVKGRQVAIAGRIQTRSYEGNDGQKRYVTEVVAEDVQFLGTREGTGGGSGSKFPSDDVPGFGGGDNDFSPIDGDDDIPF
ncbi:single-stranded DNA-binding protein A [Oxobacter pfennigii]|uniref:Single-stranded DNA-binding protein n=1 Tax=Oxobacter pfennigii TaxID=36849 RepID=A0A0N8NST2_9CLOT|nr:single-stranded DNA-binding protein [Oxobacter pfennigii]KPU42904.1 single-stranded DNA-binding protein A [Oxobacter pfennigii]